jgi:sn-glycerol 3-phosphate transport system substrate-binding protein
VLVAVVAWLASGGAARAEVTVQFWHSMTGHLGEVLGGLVQRFNSSPAAQGKIRVELQFVGTYEEGLNKLRTALLAHRAPHIVQITDIGTQLLADAHVTVPLQDLAAVDPDFPLSELLPQVRRYYEVRGKLQSLPFATSNPIIYYNADAFAQAHVKEPPKTFSELYDVAKRLTDPAAKTTGITWPLHSWFFEQFLAEQGQSLADHDNGRSARASAVLCDSPAGVAFVTLWAKMVKDGVFANVGRGWGPAEQNFLAGRSAMLITSTSDVFEVAKKATFKVLTAALPHPDGAVPGGTIIGGNSLWILAGKPREEEHAAYEFVKFMASRATQRTWHTGTGYFPIRSDVIAELEAEGFYRDNPAARTAIDQLRASPDVPATHGALLGIFPEARVHIESAIELVLAGQLDPAAALAKAKAQTDAALARYNRGREP